MVISVRFGTLGETPPTLNTPTGLLSSEVNGRGGLMLAGKIAA